MERRPICLGYDGRGAGRAAEALAHSMSRHDRQRSHTMPADRPQYLLVTEAKQDESGPGTWRFSLQPAAGGDAISAADSEGDSSGDRLELLAAVRGLEALDQPARVKLVTRSRYVRRGICRELERWRQIGFRWERFGRLVPIRDQDLWHRIDRALAIHEVVCASSAVDAHSNATVEPAEIAAVVIHGDARDDASEPWSNPTLVIGRAKRRRRNVLAIATHRQPLQDLVIWNTKRRPELSRSA